MTVFISGGCKNGKSTIAEHTAKVLAGDGPLYYIATMIPSDEEDRARIRRHVASRDGLGFETIECGINILSCLEKADADGTFLLDSVTALLANEMFRGNGADFNVSGRVAQELVRLARAVGNAVFVSDYIYSDAAQYDGFTQAYRSGLAKIDRTLAAACDTVAEICAGSPYLHKGGLPQ